MTQEHGPDDYEFDAECPECKGGGVVSRAAQPPGDVPGLLHTLEVLRQRWSHNANFEATIGACITEIELCVERAARATSTKEEGLPPGFRDIDDVVADHERDPAKKAALDAARKRLGKGEEV